MHPDRHHLRSLLAFGVQHVERIPQIGEEMLRRVESLSRCEPHVVRIEGVGYDQVRPHLALRCFDFRPEWQVVPVIIRVIQKAAVLHHKAPSIWAIPSGVPTTRWLIGQALDYFAGNSHVLSLSLFVDLLIVNPAPAVGSNFVPQFNEGRCHLPVAFEGHSYTEDSQRQPPALKFAQNAPDSGPRSILVNRLDTEMASRVG